MAVTKIWDVKSRLDHVIGYVTDPEKTYNAGYDDGEQKYFVTAMNCNATCAKRQFQNVKKQFSKTSGIIAYHGYQSFAPGRSQCAGSAPDRRRACRTALGGPLSGDRIDSREYGLHP